MDGQLPQVDSGAASGHQGATSIGIESLPVIGGVAEDRERIRQLLGEADTDGFLLRSPSTLIPAAVNDAPVLSLLQPRLRIINNSAIPYSLNEGALWTGRGVNAELSVGSMLRYGRLTAIFMPHFLAQENADFQTIPYSRYATPPRSIYAAPWYPAGESIDRPSRFGDKTFYGSSLGQSSVTLDAGKLSIAAGTENLWWGPGIRNSLIMSNNAPGFPHLMLRTSRPLGTPVGTVEGRWLVGRLGGSSYFDLESRNRRRSISAMVVTLTPAFDSGLTLGASRAVYAPVDGSAAWTMDWFNVFRNVGRPSTAAARLTPTAEEPYPVLGPDQILSLFGRWVFPEAGVEAYAEWGRTEQPKNLRDLLVSPHHTQAYTVGLQWATELSASGVVRLHAEASNLEESSTYRQRPITSWYTSAAVPEGYTHRGRVIGAAIGPGSSSQWVAGDYLARDWQVGLFAGRVRWENDAYYDSPGASYFGHDTSLLAGIRGGLAVGPFSATAEAKAESRINYLYQHIPITAGDIRSVDIRNYTLRLTIGTAADFRRGPS